MLLFNFVLFKIFIAFKYGMYELYSKKNTPASQAKKKFLTFSIQNIPIQKGSRYKKKSRLKAQWKDEKDSGMKWVQILTKRTASKEFSSLVLRHWSG